MAEEEEDTTSPVVGWAEALSLYAAVSLCMGPNSITLVGTYASKTSRCKYSNPNGAHTALSVEIHVECRDGLTHGR